MKHESLLFNFFSLLAAALAFVLISGTALPPLVAAHFTGRGGADGYMPRNAYLALMASLTVGLPMLIVFLQSLVKLLPTRLINLPHRDHWLAPERRMETLNFICRLGIWFGMLLTAFLAFVHGLLVLANQVQPPHFSVLLLIAGLIAFVAAIVICIGATFCHFRRLPSCR